MKKLLIPLFLLAIMSASALAETWQVDAEYTFDGHLTVISSPIMRILVTDNNILTQRNNAEGFYIHDRTAVYSTEEGGGGDNTLVDFPREINSTHYIGTLNANPYIKTHAGATVCGGAQVRFGTAFPGGANDQYMYHFSLDGWLGEYDLTTCALTEYDLSGFYMDQVIDADATYIYGDAEVIRISDKAVVLSGASSLDNDNPTYFDDLYLYGFDGAGNYRAIDKATYTQQWSQACFGGTCEQFVTDFQTGNAYYSLDDEVYVLTPGTWGTSEVELKDSLGDPLVLDLIDGIDFHDGKAFVKTYVAGPTHKIYEMSRTICEPDWDCNGYEECVRPMEEASCNSVTDLNACGTAYTGNYSEFPTRRCTYISTGGSGVSALSVIALDPEPTSTEVEPAEEEERIWDKWNLNQRIIIGTLIIGVIAGTVAVFNMFSPKKARRVKRRKRK